MVNMEMEMVIYMILCEIVGDYIVLGSLWIGGLIIMIIITK